MDSQFYDPPAFSEYADGNYLSWLGFATISELSSPSKKSFNWMPEN
jgi:hypothetical protein